MNQLTLRQIPADIDNRLRDSARKSGKSLNRIVIELLGKALGIDALPKRKRSLHHLAGTWSKKEAEEFDRNTAVFETIDHEMWKK